MPSTSQGSSSRRRIVDTQSWHSCGVLWLPWRPFEPNLATSACGVFVLVGIVWSAFCLLWCDVLGGSDSGLVECGCGWLFVRWWREDAIDVWWYSGFRCSMFELTLKEACYLSSLSPENFRAISQVFLLSEWYRLWKRKFARLWRAWKFSGHMPTEFRAGCAITNGSVPPMCRQATRAAFSFLMDIWDLQPHWSYRNFASK